MNPLDTRHHIFCSLKFCRLFLMNPLDPRHHIFCSLNCLRPAQYLAGSPNLKPPIARTGPEKPLTTHPCCPWQNSRLLASTLHIAPLLPWVLPSMFFPTMPLYPRGGPGGGAAGGAA